MSKALKIFGVICGIAAFIFCLAGGLAVMDKSVENSALEGVGFFFIGMAFFAGPAVIILSLGGKPSTKVQATKRVVTSKARPESKGKPKSTPATGEAATVIYVGNLSPEANETVLKTAFSGFGEIKKVQIIKERSGRPKGFGFVEMLGKDQALAAIEALNGEELAGRPLKVNLAKPKGQGQGQGQGRGRSRNQNQNKEQVQDHSDNVSSRPPNIFE